jgi:gluconate 2-dehydrogenase alpha chain
VAIEKTDVVIVGVGAAGGILAAELGKAGMKVIGLERGPRLKTEDFTPHDELRFFQRQDLRPNVKRQPVTWRPNANTRAEPLPALAYGNQAGGGTVHYGAVSWRLHEDDFRARSHTVERYGASAVPADSSLVDWPLSYADLEPYYDRAEYELGVSGKAGNIQGNKIAGGNVFEAPRRRDYPLPPLRDDQSGVIFHGAAQKLGYHPFPTPRAILSQDYNGRPGCTYCGFCQAFGCHVGAKSSILVTKLPEADATGNFKLITGAMCYRVNGDNSGRVIGVSYYGPGGSDNTIEADLVILSPFIYDNTRLLLLSKTDKFPNGLANFQRTGRQASDGPHDAECVRRLRRSLPQCLHGAERPEAHDRRLRCRQLRPCRRGVHPRLADFDRHDQRARGSDRHHDLQPAARHPALGCSVPRLPRKILRETGGDGRTDRKSTLCRPDDRSRPQCPRPMGPAGAAPDL